MLRGNHDYDNYEVSLGSERIGSAVGERKQRKGRINWDQRGPQGHGYELIYPQPATQEAEHDNGSYRNEYHMVREED